MRTFREYIIHYDGTRLEEGNMRKLLTTGLLGAAIGLPIGSRSNYIKYLSKDKPATSIHNPKLPIYSKLPEIVPSKFADKSKKIMVVDQSKKTTADDQSKKTTADDRSKKITVDNQIDKPSIRQSTLDLVKSFEGFYPKAYNDGFGNVTIGYGFTKHTLPGLEWGDRISKAEADRHLYKVLKAREPFVYKNIKTPITQEQFDALISWIYNVGGSAAKRSVLIKKINNGDYESAAKEFIKWNHVDGRRVRGLTIRREKEKELFSAGIPEVQNMRSSNA